MTTYETWLLAIKLTSEWEDQLTLGSVCEWQDQSRRQ